MTNNFDREYMRSPQLSDWLNDFATQQLKSANTTEAINGIFKKKNDLDAVEAMVNELRKRVGLDLINEETIKTASLNRLAEESLEGGLGDGLKDSEVDKEQLEKGIDVEKEHTPNIKIRKEIAKDHLAENDKYYDYLEEMENKMDKEAKASFIHRLADIASTWEEVGNVKLARKIDGLILKISEELSGKSILDKHPKLNDFIKNIINTRGGFIDTPALLEMVTNALYGIIPNLKLKDKDKDEIKDFIDKIKKEKKGPTKEDEFNVDSLILPLNDTNESYDIFSGSKR